MPGLSQSKSEHKGGGVPRASLSTTWALALNASEIIEKSFHTR